MSTRHVILGLLVKQPMSGYDIKALFKGLSWMTGSPSYGSLYPTLHALREEELVNVTVQMGEGKPSRKLYTITERGHQALRAWLGRPATPELSTKDFVRQLIVFENTSKDELRSYLERRREQLTAYLSGTNSVRQLDALQPETDSGQRLVYDYGVAMARAEMSWLDERLRELDRSPADTAISDELSPDPDSTHVLS